VTSQSPAQAGLPTKNYVDAWASLRLMVIDQKLSWSGREKDHLFLNLGGLEFAELSALSGADSVGDGRGLALCDWDDDGRLDIFLKSRTGPRVQFYRNQLESSGRFLTVDLQGVNCNRDAIGARVEVEAGGHVFKKTLYAGDSYLAQSSKRLHFGLGKAERVERLSVRWPDGTRDEYRDLAVDGRFLVVQGQAEIRPVPARPASALAAAPSVACQPGGGVVRVPLVEKLPLGPLPAPAFDDPGRTFADLGNGPVLVNLWGTTCAGCLKEFGQWHERRDEIEGSGLRIVTLCTDGVEQRAQAQEILERNGLTRGAGVADARLLKALEPVLSSVLGNSEVLPLPTSLLLDARGQLVVLYLGPVELERLLADVRQLSKMDPDVSNATRLMGGLRLLTRPRDFEALAEKLRAADLPALAAFYSGLAH